MIGFALTAVVLLFAAAMVVSSRDLVRGVLWLGVVLVATAVAFVQLRADAIAALQVMLYTGGVITLMIFAVLLTWKRSDGRPTSEVTGRGRGVIGAVGIFGVIAAAILKTPIEVGPALEEANTAAVGELFLTRHVLAFELLSVLLLAAMVGAIVIARRRDA